MSINYNQYLKQDKCVACKIFTAPLFFALGGYFAIKNRELWQNDPIPQNMNSYDLPISLRKFTKYAMIGIPIMFFCVGTHCLYEAHLGIQEEKQNKEII